MNTLDCPACQYAFDLDSIATPIECPRCGCHVELAEASAAGDELAEVIPLIEERPRLADGARPTYRRAPNSYVHDGCGATTRISRDIVTWFTSDPYRLTTSTLCSGCHRYVSLRSVFWPETGESVAAYRARLRGEMHPLLIVLRVFIGPGVLALLLAILAAAAAAPKNKPGAFLLVGFVGLIGSYFAVGFLFQYLRDPDKAVR